MSVYVARPLLVSESAAAVDGDGLPFVMLTLLLAAVWWTTAVFRPGLARRFGWADWAWLALLAWQAAGTLIAVRTGWARAAINVFWEWVGLGLGFLLLRQLVASDRELRAVVVVMIALAVVLAVYGLFQFFVSLPAMREAYRLHPNKVLQESRVVAPPGSPARMLFEQRLDSTEPMATYALANSLAGFLVPWLIMTIGTACLASPGDARGGRNVRRWATAAGVALPLAVCLVLTKSRSAYAATLCGVVGIVILRLTRVGISGDNRTESVPYRRLLAKRATRSLVPLGALMAVVLLAVAVGGQSLDREIFTEAAKSLSYRAHYWRGALEMIRDQPCFGCGLGNFQDNYTRYKLPEASEAVADPHNFILEVGSTSGTPALLAFLAIFLGAALDLRRSATTVSEASRTSQDPATRTGVDTVLGGGAAGFLLAFLVGLFSTVGLPIELLAVGLVTVAAAALLGWRWIESGALPPALPLIALAALLVNLLAAGGIGFTGVAGSLWLLLAVALGLGCNARPIAKLPRPVAVGIVAAPLVLGVLCYFSAFLPALRCKTLLAEAEAEPSIAEQRFRAAAQADALADQPWRGLAAIALARLDRDGDRSIDLWKEAQSEILQRRPNSSAAWHQAGDGYFLIYRKLIDERARDEAIHHYRRAVDLYPNQALGRAHLALALAAAEEWDEARQQASEALRLHQLTPHADQKLPEELVVKLQSLVATE